MGTRITETRLMSH